jgi:hypothetical protein
MVPARAPGKPLFPPAPPKQAPAQPPAQAPARPREAPKFSAIVTLLGREMASVAIDMVKEFDQRVLNGRSTVAEVRLLEALVEAQGLALDRMTKQIEAMRQRLPQDAVFTDGDALFEQMKAFAQRRAVVEGLAELHSHAAAGRIPVPKYLALVRSIARDHFQQSVLPLLKRQFILR